MRCSALLYSIVQCSTVQCIAIKDSVVQCSTVHCSVIQYKTVQFSTVQNSRFFSDPRLGPDTMELNRSCHLDSWKTGAGEGAGEGASV